MPLADEGRRDEADRNAVPGIEEQHGTDTIASNRASKKISPSSTRRHIVWLSASSLMSILFPFNCLFVRLYVVIC